MDPETLYPNSRRSEKNRQLMALSCIEGTGCSAGYWVHVLIVLDVQPVLQFVWRCDAMVLGNCDAARPHSRYIMRKVSIVDRMGSTTSVEEEPDEARLAFVDRRADCSIVVRPKTLLEVLKGATNYVMLLSIALLTCWQAVPHVAASTTGLDR
jgi:hypothetical protein